ncbi:nitrilase-related carbon-nitrogen hydrolase [Paraferrimonas sedimenticola]|uniref:CN hydrolase domain-containing protein n=1 Tax=Paraferrimonas sedimenticola TaxID=375674 RepID=A0AA37RX70_9GAMM|nr:nitrilase-related carbon-nitrogen hydrolase [Paraferrimonas sedimenticola]GLP96332.1 hypothetical protein GCM10007895_16380 [Paraferrimonas sedimenticola]
MTRVAVLQFATTLDVAENLETCCRMIDQAAEVNPDVMVLPEFCNALSWYESQQQAFELAVSLDGEFVKTLASKAAQHKTYLVVNVTVRRHPLMVEQISVTSLLFDRRGRLVHQADKQTLMGHENFFFQRAKQRAGVYSSDTGRLGIFACRDGVTFETARGLAIDGAQLFCDSLNSFALDEARLHVPSRAVENGVFMAAANKVGPLIPEDQLAQVAEQTGIPERFLMGAGQSQIVSPSGEVLAMAPYNQEAFVWADVDLSEVAANTRPDGSKLLQLRRPELYTELSVNPAQQEYQSSARPVIAAMLAPVGYPQQRMQTVLENIVDEAFDVMVLAEGCFDDANYSLTDLVGTLKQALADSAKYVCFSFKQASGIRAILVGSEGVVASQGLLHPSQRYGDAELAGDIGVHQLPFGKVALFCGDDGHIPESVKVAALKGAQLILYPFSLQQAWENQLALPSRSAENRVAIVASSYHKVRMGGLICSLETDFTLLTPWSDRQFDGHINQPPMVLQGADGEITQCKIPLQAANNKLMSADTDLLADRPFHLCERLIAQRVSA